MMKQIVHSPEALGQFIKRVRKFKKITQFEVGLNFKIDQTTVSSIELGPKGQGWKRFFDY